MLAALGWIRQTAQLAEQLKPIDLSPVPALDDPTALQSVDPDAWHPDAPACRRDPFELTLVSPAPREARDALLPPADQVLNGVGGVRECRPNDRYERLLVCGIGRIETRIGNGKVRSVPDLVPESAHDALVRLSGHVAP